MGGCLQAQKSRPEVLSLGSGEHEARSTEVTGPYEKNTELSSSTAVSRDTGRKVPTGQPLCHHQELARGSQTVRQESHSRTPGSGKHGKGERLGVSRAGTDTEKLQRGA